MTQDNELQGLLILFASPDLEEMLVDELLLQSAISGFSTSNSSGHGTVHANSKLSLVEQVTGRQKRVQFMMHATIPALREVIAVLKVKFENAEIHYILLPVIEAQTI